MCSPFFCSVISSQGMQENDIFLLGCISVQYEIGNAKLLMLCWVWSLSKSIFEMKIVNPTACFFPEHMNFWKFLSIEPQQASISWPRHFLSQVGKQTLVCAVCVLLSDLNQAIVYMEEHVRNSPKEISFALRPNKIRLIYKITALL